MSGGLLAFHHLSLSVPDLERSVAWYQEVLGLQITAEVEGAGFRRTRMRSAGGGVTFTLTCHDERSGDRFDERRTGMDHVSFRLAAEELAGWKARLEQFDVDHSEIKAASGESVMITLRDPDNIQLELFFGDSHTPTPREAQAP